MGRKSTMPKIIAALELAPAGLTQIQLQRITGASAGAVHAHIHRLHDEGRAFIASWKTDTAGKIKGGVYQARYRLGKGEDKPKPPALTRTEISQRLRARIRKSGELAEYRAKVAEDEKRRYWLKKQPKRDPLIAALFGPANDAQRVAA